MTSGLQCPQVINKQCIQNVRRLPLPQVEIPLKALKLWFWMLDDSGEPKLEKQSEQALLNLFDSVPSARRYFKERVCEA